MPASFQVSQSASTPANVTITDDSTGLSGTITQRRVFVSQSDGTYLTGDGTVNYTEWPLAQSSITLDILVNDTAALIKVQWLTVTNVVVDEVENTFALCQFGMQFFYYLIGLQGLTPGIYQDTNYSGNLAIFWTNLIAGINAITYGSDLSAAQACFDREIWMQQNQNVFF